MKKLPTETLEERIHRLHPYFEVHKPHGEGPFPIILMFHGCGRTDEPMPPYVKEAVKAGFACLNVDSYGPRHISLIEAVSTVCTGIQLWGRDRAGDIAAAIAWVKTLDWVDKNNIHAAGWSHGGWTVMDAICLEDEIYEHAKISDLGKAPFESLKSAFIVYPWCGAGSFSMSRGWKRNVPSHMIVCGRDVVVGDYLPKRTAQKLKQEGIDIEITYFERATHGFDEIKPLHPAQKHDEELTHRAAKMLVDFVKANLA